MKESFCKLELKNCSLLHTLQSAVYCMFSLSLSNCMNILHFPWTFVQFILCAAVQKMLKAFFVSTWLCFHAHQERGSQLSTWIYIIYDLVVFIQTSALEPWNIEPFSHLILSGFWLFLFLLKHNNYLNCAKITQNRYLKEISLLKPLQSRNGAL